jgi:hypothetical protein
MMSGMGKNEKIEVFLSDGSDLRALVLTVEGVHNFASG